MKSFVLRPAWDRPAQLHGPREYDAMVRRLRWNVRKGFSKLAPDGGSLDVRAFGVRIGYWPCLKGPFIEVAFNTRRYELWYGLPSYR